MNHQIKAEREHLAYQQIFCFHPEIHTMTFHFISLHNPE